MLIGFYVSNWKSIREEIQFSMEASREQNHGERLYELKKFQKRILPAAIMFGGNASGKSSFVHALRFMRSFVVDGGKYALRTHLKPHAFSVETKDQPTTFEVDLYLDGFLYNYSFSCTKMKVIEEKLIKVNTKRERVLFHRKDGVIAYPDVKLSEREQMRRDLIAESTIESKLFLTNTMEMNLNDYEIVYDWFKDSLVIIEPDTYFSRHTIYSSAEVIELYNEILPKIDTGIKRVELRDATKSEAKVSDDILEYLSERMNEDEQTEALFAHLDEFVYVSLSQDEKPKFKRLVSIHEDTAGQEVQTSLVDESDGTRRVLDLIPAFCSRKKRSINLTFVIDEIDRSLHTSLTRYLYKNFFERCQPSCGAETAIAVNRDQIISTTHDQDLIDQSLFRRDEIWFFERIDGATELVSVAQYEDARKDKDLRKSYREGRMGGLPQFDLL